MSSSYIRRLKLFDEVWNPPLDYHITDPLNYKQKLRSKVKSTYLLINYLEKQIASQEIPESSKEIYFRPQLKRAYKSLKAFEHQGAMFLA